MFEGLKKRDFAALIVVCAVSAWGSIYVIKNYIIGPRNDPLERAGGLKPEQQPK